MVAVLFVTAHPDDESMFFAPTAIDLVQRGLQAALLCLSTGNADGLGKVRAQELRRACSLLGIVKDHVVLVDDPQLQDGMQQRWPASAVAEHVASVVQRFQPEQIVTFDAGGVSGHPNHLAAHMGVLHWWAAARSSGGSSAPEVWQLETVALPRKYLALLEAPLSWLAVSLRRRLIRPPGRLVLCSRPARAWRALLAHRSQMVWYRRIWLALSRYMYVNTLVKHA